MSTRIVVPCYNEASRLPSGEFRNFFLEHPGIELLFVNDGSTDDTGGVLRVIAEAAPDRVEILELAQNQGKAEAVRRGLVQAIARGSDFVGYFDADLATPLAAIPEMMRSFDGDSDLDIVIGSRVQLLGRSIERNPARHYAGRVFATAASMLLRMPVYDTQCGAKIFRVRGSLSDALAEPFGSRWVFDVELLRRLIITRQEHGELPVEHATLEFPLLQWRDVRGSKVRPTDFPLAFIEIVRMAARYGDAGFD